MNVLFFQNLNSIWRENLDLLRTDFPDHHFWTPEAEGFPGIGAMDVIIGGKPGSEDIEAAERLKLVIVPFAGINHLPLGLIAQRGIRVANSHGNAPFVAERALAMILAWYGKLIEYHNDLKSGQWHGFWVGKGLDDTWRSIRGTRCAILGTGEIARSLAEQLAPFEVDVVGCRRKHVRDSIPGFSRIFYDIDEAIDGADTVVITLPGTDETASLFNAERLSRMKNTLLVNVGRGSIIEEKALHEALESGSLAGAAIDCWYTYPEEGSTSGPPSSYPLYLSDRVILSPHVAGFTGQAARRNIEQGFENLRLFLENDSLLFEADPAGGY
jgi:phosphoglycerate dehydrogenase-like enzyme